MPTISQQQIDLALTDLPGWTYEDGEITRQFRFDDFNEAFAFISQVALLQEKLDHHATITNTYSHVTIATSTHDEGGITARDIKLATEINARAGNAQA
jgi:4a-hydroxytetrahydrobiopterin dehydratase